MREPALARTEPPFAPPSRSLVTFLSRLSEFFQWRELIKAAPLSALQRLVTIHAKFPSKFQGQAMPLSYVIWMPRLVRCPREPVASVPDHFLTSSVSVRERPDDRLGQADVTAKSRQSPGTPFST